jgi:2-octaprenyl-6-methoxyphenol hydroxylase
MTGETPFDVLVAGAGPVGMALALALARQDLAVGLVDARDPATPAREDARAYLVAAGGWRLFEAVGAAQRLAPFAEPVQAIENRAAGGRIAFDLDDASEGEALGYMIEAQRLEAGLWDAVAAEPRIRVMAPRRVAAAAFGDPVARIETDHGTLTARLVAACDGGRSVLRGQAGIRSGGHAYPLKALSTFVSLPMGHDGVARQAFLREGPLAILPMTGDRANLVWSVRAPVADALAAMSAAAFEAELGRAGEGFVSGLRLAGPRGVFPLELMLAERFSAHRLALAGDAAHRVHPLAGQGLNLGLKDAAALADVVAETLQLGLDIGSAAQLEAYGRWRRPDAVATAAAMEGFARTFGGPAPIRTLAGLAMAAAGRMGPARRWFARQAVGSAGDVPSLMRPRDPFAA